MKTKMYFLLSILLITTSTMCVQAQQKIGVLNSNVLFSQLPESLKIDSQFSKEVNMYQEGYDNLLRTTKDTLKISKFLHSADSILREERMKMLYPMVSRIDSSIKKIAQQNKYDIIFDSKDGSIIYNSGANDITNEVRDQTIRLKNEEDNEKMKLHK